MSKENTRNEVARYNMDGAGILRVIGSMDRHDEQVEFLDWQLAQREQRIKEPEGALKKAQGTLSTCARRLAEYGSDYSFEVSAIRLELNAAVKNSPQPATPSNKLT